MEASYKENLVDDRAGSDLRKTRKWPESLTGKSLLPLKSLSQVVTLVLNILTISFFCSQATKERNALYFVLKSSMLRYMQETLKKHFWSQWTKCYVSLAPWVQLMFRVSMTSFLMYLSFLMYFESTIFCHFSSVSQASTDVSESAL